MSEDVQIGPKIRMLRHQRGMTLKELSARSGLSISLISQVERGLVSPSIAALKKVAASIDTSMACFFGSERSEHELVVRKDERKTLIMPGGDVTYQLLSPDLVNKKAEFAYIRMDPSVYSPKTPLAHDGEEYGLVLKGKAKVTIDGKAHILSEGDSICFQSQKPHLFDSYGDEETVLVWVLVPPGWA